MTALQDWILRLLAGIGLWHETATDAQIYWPGILAAFATLALCMIALLLVLDASRRTLAVPGWSYLQKSVGLLAAETDSLRQNIEALYEERDGLRIEVDTLKEDRAALQSVRAQKDEEERRLVEITSRLEALAQDRVEVAALRLEVEHLQAEKSQLTAKIVALREDETKAHPARSAPRAVV
jgi:regulator of replication initiation timing